MNNYLYKISTKLMKLSSNNNPSSMRKLSRYRYESTPFSALFKYRFIGFKSTPLSYDMVSNVEYTILNNGCASLYGELMPKCIDLDANSISLCPFSQYCAEVEYESRIREEIYSNF